ncbi:hypothetical protein K0M31_008792 [Melipona bicolor]|uniref:Uncharacterized protein n=1 Tax=Melipona bicolor TaxID=60889 RepID=A0AA40FPV5_9HYME|nr:hypothetical protein K0M31_008792 [Melipona bicolor]
MTRKRWKWGKKGKSLESRPNRSEERTKPSGNEAGSQAEHRQSSSISNEVAASKSSEDKSKDVEGPVKEVLAQSGSTANLPCKITEPGAGTVNVVT